jgi:hypothetical protein
MARTRWPSDLRTPASSPGRADQTGSAGGCLNLGPGRQIVSQDSPDGVSRIGGQAGTQAPDTTPVPGQDRGSRAARSEALSTVSLPNLAGLASQLADRAMQPDPPVLRGLGA